MIGKSQALNTWLKEFIYNVLIQPFHCIIYLAFMTIIMGLIGSPSDINWFDGAGLGAAIVSIFIMLFIKQAEPIVRKIFGFDNATSLGSVVASGAILMNSINAASNAMKKNKKDSSDSKGSGKSSKPKVSNNANRNSNNIKKSQNSSGGSSQNSGRGSSQNNGGNSSQNSGGSNSKNGKGGNSQNSGRNNSQNGRNLNTEKSQAGSERVEDVLKNIVTKGSKVALRTAGMAIGAMSSNDSIAGAITGYNYGKAFGEGAQRIAGRGRKIANSATRKVRMKKQVNELIDKYNKIQKDTKWDDDTMYKKSEALLNISDLSKVSNPQLREYGQVLHNYREQFQKYKEPTDMVLDAIDKVQSGELKKAKESIKKYTRKK